MKKYNFEIDGKKFEVEVNLKNSDVAEVKVNNKNFDIKISGHSPEAKKPEAKKPEAKKPEAKKPEAKKPEQSEQSNPGDLLALMPGKIIKVLVSEGQKIKMGEPVIIMESMKMEQTIVSSADGVIESLNVSEGETIEVGSVMLVIR
ncbi:MAG: biotin/lipoyl-containing protein [Chloroflexota bacterium]|nr:biotin/lipoyl-containing protein [Chloroflexota bacterium]